MNISAKSIMTLLFALLLLSALLTACAVAQSTSDVNNDSTAEKPSASPSQETDNGAEKLYRVLDVTGSNSLSGDARALAGGALFNEFTNSNASPEKAFEIKGRTYTLQYDSSRTYSYKDEIIDRYVDKNAADPDKALVCSIRQEKDGSYTLTHVSAYEDVFDLRIGALSNPVQEDIKALIENKLSDFVDFSRFNDFSCGHFALNGDGTLRNVQMEWKSKSDGYETGSLTFSHHATNGSDEKAGSWALMYQAPADIPEALLGSLDKEAADRSIESAMMAQFDNFVRFRRDTADPQIVTYQGKYAIFEVIGVHYMTTADNAASEQSIARCILLMLE